MAPRHFINPKKLLIQEIIVAMIGVLLLAGVAFALGVRVNAYATDIKVKRIEANVKAAQRDSLSLLIEQDAIASPHIAALRHILPTKEELISFDEDLRRLARDLDASFSFSLTGESEASATAPGSLHFTITVQGRFDQVTAYLERVRTLSYFIEIPALTLAVRGDQYSAQITGRAFTR